MYYPKHSTDSMQSLSNYQWQFSQNWTKKISQCVWKHKRQQIEKAVLRKKNGAGGINLLDFRLYCKPTVTKKAWFKHKNRNNRPMGHDRKCRETHAPMCTLSLRKDARIYNGEKIVSLVNGDVKTAPLCKRMKLEHSLPPYTKIKSKWTKDLNVRPEIIKLLEENIGRTLFDINHSKILYDLLHRVMEIKRKMNKWGLVKLKSFFTVKETLNKVKPSEWEKIRASKTTGKGLVSRTCKQLIHPIPEKQATQSKSGQTQTNISPRRHMYVQEAHEKMLNIVYY